MPASSPAPLRVLILGGSSDATSLARALIGRADVDVTLSLAGRTREPAPQPLPTRIGGFGGGEGLAAFIRAESIAMLVDATHPFAEQMSTNAASAARATGVPLIRVERLAWRAVRGDDWREVEDMAAAVAALGAEPRRAFLTVGRQRLAAFAAAPQHHYLVRTIDPAAEAEGLPNAAFIEARPPFDTEAEARLMCDHRIDVLVTKNSGGEAAYGKIAAARALGLTVVMVQRPDAIGVGMSIAEALGAIEAHAADASLVGTPRGV